MCTINEVWLWLYHYDVWFLRYKVQTTRLFVIFHPPNKPKNQNFETIGKRLEILSFYTCAARMTIIWCMVPEISSATDIIFLSCWAIFCPFTHPPNNPENQNFEKWKNSRRYYHFEHEYHKWKSSDIWFLKCGAQLA